MPGAPPSEPDDDDLTLRLQQLRGDGGAEDEDGSCDDPLAEWSTATARQLAHGMDIAQGVFDEQDFLDALAISQEEADERKSQKQRSTIELRRALRISRRSDSAVAPCVAPSASLAISPTELFKKHMLAVSYTHLTLPTILLV